MGLGKNTEHLRNCNSAAALRSRVFWVSFRYRLQKQCCVSDWDVNTDQPDGSEQSLQLLLGEALLSASERLPSEHLRLHVHRQSRFLWPGAGASCTERDDLATPHSTQFSEGMFCPGLSLGTLCLVQSPVSLDILGYWLQVSRLSCLGDITRALRQGIPCGFTVCAAHLGGLGSHTLQTQSLPRLVLCAASCEGLARLLECC